jgi:lipopolysaccharide export system protein LptC
VHTSKSDSQKINLLYLILFACIGIASVLILHHDHQQKIRRTGNIAIDSFANQATLTEYDDQGKIERMITAQNAIHSEPDGITHFVKPFILIYTKDRTPWHIRADKGTSDKKTDQIVLKENVVIHQLRTTHHTDSRMTTDELTIFTKTSRAVTDKAVTLTRPDITIHGVGLDANLKTGEYQLRSQSEAIYQPTKKRN